MPTIDQIISKFPEKFNPEAAKGMNLVFEFNILNERKFHLIVNDGACRVEEGEHDDPNVTLIADEQTFIGITTGELGGMQAFMTGRLKTEGNMMLATKLGDLFSR